LALAQYRELAAFAQFASDLDETTRKQLERGKRVTEVMKQRQYMPLSVADMAVSLYAVDRGFFDSIPVDHIVEMENRLRAFMHRGYASLLAKINQSPELNGAIESALHEALAAFKATVDGR
jgi:F-type H+/Na+-transporting ATPase subunit alpha